MKFRSFAILNALCLALSEQCLAFQVNPDPISKLVIEKTFKHKVEIPQPNPERVVPMINVYDDYSFSPEIGSKVESITNTLLQFCGVDSDPLSIVDFLPRPLSESINTKEPIPPRKGARARKVIGLDDYPTEYWFNNKIHTFGNVGFFGGVHAIVAPIATFLIDKLAYNKLDVRRSISKRLRQIVNRSNARVLDLCCGVGMSTRALQSAFCDAEVIVGIDTSPQMIKMAKLLNNRIDCWDRFADEVGRKVQGNDALNAAKCLLQNLQFQISGDISVVSSQLRKLQRELDMKNTKDVSYALGNAERTIFPDQSFDLVTIMYGFHEAPYLGRYLMLREARRVLQNGATLALVDIVPEYTPSETMLAGEPYVEEYQKNIHKQMKNIRGFKNLSYEAIIPNHVGVWLLTREDRAV